MIPCHLHKFGGSSLADADCYRRVAHILLTHGNENDLIVVSAAGKSTNALYQLLTLKTRNNAWDGTLDELITYQQQLVSQLLNNEQAAILNQSIAADKTNITAILNHSTLDNYQKNEVVSYGERWSARLMAALLVDSGVSAAFVDARDILIARDGITPQINLSDSKAKLQNCLAKYPNQRLVITGFICSDVNGNTLLLGRNGSDYSATLIASLADIERVTIWTDVEGVFNADPNKISDAKLLNSMSLAEADRLARLGSPVLHARTLQPLFNANVSLAVRSSYASHTDFTLITPQSDATSAPVVTHLNEVLLISFVSSYSLTDILAELAASGVVPLGAWEQVNQRIELAFISDATAEITQLIELITDKMGLTEVTHNNDFGLVALVSSAANQYQRSFARLLSRDAKPLYQDNLSLVTLVPQSQVNLLAQKVHRRCAGPRKRIGVVLLGVGNIGMTWMSLFQQAQKRLNAELEAHVELIGLVRSQKALIINESAEPQTLLTRFETEAAPWEYDSLLTQLDAATCDEIVALDISASASLTLQYPAFLSRGIHIVSANKLAGSGPSTFYNELKQLLRNRRLFWRYNASCGAGLPIQHALNDLHNNGDKVAGIGGIFSGTLCWLFEHFDGSKPFSQLVLEAKALGITEPDPRDDLSGRDMQRKLLILAREIGLELELSDIKLNSLVPPALADIPLGQFLERITELDESMAQQCRAADEQDKVLRYIAALDCNNNTITAEVGIQWVSSDNPYANLTPGDNIFVINSEFYQGNPLIIRGPGAGREVTAAAIQSDLVQVCRDILQE